MTYGDRCKTTKQAEGQYELGGAERSWTIPRFICGREKKKTTTMVMVNEHVINIVLSQTYLLGSSSAVNFALNQSSVSRDEQMT